MPGTNGAPMGGVACFLIMYSLLYRASGHAMHPYEAILLRFTGTLEPESRLPPRVQSLDAFALQCHMAE
jgi:hypothetical protein